MSPVRATNITLNDAIDRWHQRAKARGLSDATLRSAVYTLQRLSTWLADRRRPNPGVHTITGPDLDDFCYGRDGIRIGISAGSFNTYRAHLKMFFEYARAMNWTDADPMLRLDPAKPDPQKPRLILSASELLALLDHCNNPVQRIGCAIGMNTGLRGNDIRHLTIFDASLANGTLQTEIRKTRKQDVKPITADLHNELTRWLITYAKMTGVGTVDHLPNEWFLVPSYRSRIDGDRGQKVVLRPDEMFAQVYQLVKAPLSRMGYPTKGEGFHTLRRSSARALFESLRDKGEARDYALMVVKDYLNHASVVQTEKYLGLNQERTIRDESLRDRPFLSELAAREQAKLSPSEQQIPGRIHYGAAG